MICNKCLVPMNQFDELNGGQATDECYETFAVMECPQCGQMVIEYYAAIPLEDGLFSFENSKTQLEFNQTIRDKVYKTASESNV